jgi:hypothetical protein
MSQVKLKYCKAYRAADVRAFENWPASAGADVEVLYVHDDLTVTAGADRNEAVVFAQIDASWRAFCLDRLGFDPQTWVG